MTVTPGAVSLTVGFFSECNFLVLSLTSTRVFITLISTLLTLSSFNSSSGFSLWEDAGSEGLVIQDHFQGNRTTSKSCAAESGRLMALHPDLAKAPLSRMKPI